MLNRFLRNCAIFTLPLIFVHLSHGGGVWSGALGGLGDALVEEARQQREDERIRREQERVIEFERRRTEIDLQNQRRLIEQQAEARRRAAENAAYSKALDEQQRRIEARKQGVTGSGFFVTDRGHILTNAHVVGDFKHVQVKTMNSTFYEARVVEIDKEKDLALLAIDIRSTGLKIAQSTADAKGEDVLAVGYPMPGVQGQESKITNGIVSSLSGMKGADNWMQISAAIQGGNSGGPLVTSKGVVLGVVVASINAKKILENSGNIIQNVNYAIKSEEVIGFLKKLRLENIVKPMQGKPLRWVDENTVMVLARDSSFAGDFVPMPTSSKLIPPERQAEEDFKEVASAHSVSALRSYLAKSQQNAWTIEAKKMLQQMDKDRWKESSSSDSIEGYQKYLEEFPEGLFVAKAKSAFGQIEKAVWQSALRSNSVQAFQAFIQKFPASTKIEEATQRISALDQKEWFTAANLNSVSSYEKYMSAMETGKFRLQAENNIRELKKAEAVALQKEQAKVPVATLSPVIGQSTSVLNPPLIGVKPLNVGTVDVVYADLGYVEIALVGRIRTDKPVSIATQNALVTGRVAKVKGNRASVVIEADILMLRTGDQVVQ